MAIHLRYDTTTADQIAKLDRFAAGSLVARRFVWFAYFAICGLAWFSAALFYVKQGHQSRGYLIYAAFAAALTVSLPWLYGWYQRSFWTSVLTEESVRGLVGPTVLKVDDHGIEEVGPVLSASRAWQDVSRIEWSEERTLIFLAPMIAVSVPAKAFPDLVTRQEFDREVNERLQASRSMVTKQPVTAALADRR